MGNRGLEKAEAGGKLKAGYSNHLYSSSSAVPSLCDIN